MSQFHSTDRTLRAGETGPARGGSCLIRLVFSAALCVAVVAGQTAAQPSVKPAKAKSDCGSAQKPAHGKAGTKAPCCPGAATNTPPSGAQPVVQQAKSTGDDSGPRWACAKPTIELPPLWKGTPVECAFDIRNEGKSDLTIKAKGV